jgi:hypothetical protein
MLAQMEANHGRLEKTEVLLRKMVANHGRLEKAEVLLRKMEAKTEAYSERAETNRERRTPAEK